MAVDSIMRSNKLKQAIKNNIANIAYFTGYTKYRLNNLAKNKCIVLMYHRVLPENIRSNSLSHGAISVSTTTFENHIQYIRNNLHPISFTKFNDKIIAGEQFKDNSCLVTFDDGWYDNYRHAFSILKKYNMPAIIFLPTAYIDQKKLFWQENLTALFLKSVEMFRINNNIDDEIKNIVKKRDIRYLYESDKLVQREYVSILVQEIKSEEYDEIASIQIKLEQLLYGSKSGNYKQGDTERQFLKWSEIKEMRKFGIEFGSHGVNHLILTKQDVNVDHELNDSKMVIEEKIGERIGSMSYPNGNYNRTIIEKTASNGYAVGFSTEFGYNRSDANPYNIRRINIHEDASSTIPLFLSRITGLW